MSRITEEEFVRLMNRIPVMEEKLNRLLLVFEKIIENKSMAGVRETDEFPHVEYSQEQADRDNIEVQGIEEKLEKARKLKEEADELQRKFRI